MHDFHQLHKVKQQVSNNCLDLSLRRVFKGCTIASCAKIAKRYPNVLIKE